MPIYEYRCPRGHTFELLQGIADDPPGECQICEAKPVEKVLYPAAIHFKGSGFYSTDYGRSGAKSDASKDGDAKSSSKSEKSASKTETSKKKKEEKG